MKPLAQEFMSAKKRLVENIFWLGALQGANYVLPIITLPYLMSHLGAEMLGLIVFAQAFIQWLVKITGYGFDFTATRQITLARNDHKRVSEIFSEVMTIKTGLMLFSLLLMTVVVFLVPKFRAHWVIYYIMFLMVLGNVLFPIWLFQGLERMRYQSILNVSAKAAGTAAIFIFIHKPSDYVLAAAIQAGVTVLAGILSMGVIRWRLKIRFTLPRNIKNLSSTMKDGTQVFISTLSTTAYGDGATLILGLVAGNVAVAYYGLAYKVFAAACGVAQPISQGIYPHLVHLCTENAKAYARARTKVFAGGLAMALAAGAALFVTAHWVARFAIGRWSGGTAIAHPDSEVLVVLLRIFSLMLMLTIMNVLLHSFILSMKRYAEMQRMYITVAFLFILISIPVTIKFGMVGMTWVVMGVESFIFIRSTQIASVFSPAQKPTVTAS